MKRRAVFLDRDGVLNQPVIREDGVSVPPPDAASMEIAEGAAAAVESLRQYGFLCICVTNQPDVARGTRTRENVEAMNARVRKAVPLDDLYTCMHDTPDSCSCRKPKPGMLLAAGKKWDIDLIRSWMVGDRASDIQAGKSAGCRTVLIRSGGTVSLPEGLLPTVVCASAAEAARIILEYERRSVREPAESV